MHHLSSPSLSKIMSGSKKRLLSSKHNAVVSFRMMYDDFNFSPLNIRPQLELERFFSATRRNLLRDCKNSENKIFRPTIHVL